MERPETPARSQLLRSRTSTFFGDDMLKAPDQLETECRKVLDDVWHLDSLEEVEMRTRAMLREVESAGRVMRQAADKALLLAHDLRHSSDRLLVERAEGLKVFSHNDLVRAARAHRRLNMPVNEEDIPWPLWSTGVNDLKTYGPGIRLYFQFLTTFTAVGFLCSLLLLPFAYICWRGHRLDRTPGVEIHLWGTSALAYTTIGNLDAGNITVMCDYLDTGVITHAFGWCDAISVLLIYIVARWFELFVIPAARRDEKEKTVTPDNFTIFVSDLPRFLPAKERHQHYETELMQHFENLLRATVTVDNARLGQRVVPADGMEDDHQEHTHLDADDHEQENPWARFKQMGRIVKIDRQNAKVLVKWSVGSNSTATYDIAGKVRTLLDASLLSRLKQANISLACEDEEKSPVYRVALVRDYGGELETIAKKKQRHHHNAYAKFARLQSAELKKKFAMKHDEALDRLTRKPVRHRAVVGAFIVFRYIKYRNFILEGEYRFSGLIGRAWTQPAYLQFCRRSIRVEEAAVPSDIFWENLDYSKLGRALRGSAIWMTCVFSLMFFFVLLCVAERESAQALGDAADACLGEVVMTQNCECTLAGYSKIVKDTAPGGLYGKCQGWIQSQIHARILAVCASSVAAAINLFSGWLVRTMSFYRKPQSFTELNLFRLKAIFVMKTMLLGVITVVVHADFSNSLKWFAGFFFGLIGTGRFRDFSPEWFAIVGSQVITPFIFSSSIPILHTIWGPLWTMEMGMLTKYKKSWPDLKRLWTPKDLPLALFQAESVSAVFSTLLFVGGMPILMLLMSVRLLITYWCDKYFLLRVAAIPKRFTTHITKTALYYVRLGCFIHSLVAIMVFGNAQIVEGVVPGFEESGARQGAFATLVDRSGKQAAVPNTILFWIIFIDHSIQLFIFVIGKPLAKAMMRWWCPQHSALKFRPATRKDMIFSEPFDERPMKEMERMKVDYNYELTENPNFKFLLTKEDAALAEQQRKVQDGRKADSDSEEEGATAYRSLKSAPSSANLEDNAHKHHKKAAASSKAGRWPAANVPRDSSGNPLKPKRLTDKPELRKAPTKRLGVGTE